MCGRAKRSGASEQEAFGLLYAENEDPSAITRTERPYRFEKVEGRYEIHLTMPFATKGEIGLFKKADELVVEIGTLRRHIGLPTSMNENDPPSPFRNVSSFAFGTPLMTPRRRPAVRDSA